MTENRRIARAAGLIGFLTLCSRVTGLVRDALIGYLFGTGAAADAFFVAFRAPNMLRRFVAEGAMGVAFVPVFSEYLVCRGQDAAQEAARVLLGMMLVLLGTLVTCGVLLAPYWVPFLAPGFLSEPAKLLLTTRLAEIVFVYVFFISLAALLGGFLNATRHFAAPAASPILLNLAIIGAALFISPHLRKPVYGLAFGVLAGGVLQVALQASTVLKRGFSLRPSWQFKHEALRRVGRLMLPALFGGAAYQVNVIIGTMLASILPEGSVSFLWYAGRIFEFPLGIVAVALGTAALPSFATQSARRDFEALRGSIDFAIRITSFLAIPAAVGMAVLAVPITTVLFSRGAFGPHETAMTAWALQSMALGLWPVSITQLLVAAFYAIGDARPPVLTAMVALFVNATLSLMLMGPPSLQNVSLFAESITTASRYLSISDLRHSGLALATALAATVHVVLLWIFLMRRLRGLNMRDLSSSLARTVSAAALMAFPVWLISQVIDWPSSGLFWPRALLLFFAVGIGVVTFVSAAHVLGSPEIGAFRAMLRERFRS